MTRSAFAIVLLLAASPAAAGSVSVAVNDASGAPVANAVVELVTNGHVELPATRVSSEAVIDQRHETFIPLVSLIHEGGRVVFTNNDTTKHQVYSFSPIRQFEFEVDQGQRSEAVTFDKPGVASIGCNIHDQMITYVYVAASPFAAMSDAKGRVQFDAVPTGAYRVNVWHPQLAPGRLAPSLPLLVSAAPASITVPVPLMAVSMSKHMHMGKY